MLGLKVALVAGAVSGANATLTYTTATTDTCDTCSATGATAVSTCTATKACSGGACKDADKSIALGSTIASTSTEYCIAGEAIMEINPADGVTPTMTCKIAATTVTVAAGKKCNSHFVCPKTQYCVASGTAVLDTGANPGTCTGLTTVAAGEVLNASALFPTQEYGANTCAAGAYASADADNLTKCNVPVADAALTKPCITEKADGTASNCVSTTFCSTASGGSFTSRQDGKKYYWGECAAPRTTAGGTGVTQAAQCKTGHKIKGGVCVDLETTANAVTHLELDAQKSCKNALVAFQKVQGGGLDWKKAVPAFKGNCAQITYDATKTQFEAFTIVHPPTSPGTAASTSAHPQCGFCSEECVTAARAAQTACSGIAAKYTYYTVLPIFTALDQYITSTAAQIQVKGTDPCALATTGCGASTARTADTKAAVTSTTAKLDTDAKINTWVGTCAVAYGSGGAGAQFASSFAVLALSALAVFA